LSERFDGDDGLDGEGETAINMISRDAIVGLYGSCWYRGEVDIEASITIARRLCVVSAAAAVYDDDAVRPQLDAHPPFSCPSRRHGKHTVQSSDVAYYPHSLANASLSRR